ncbi:hypothetical protein CT19431_MP30349 [Cupriavidus taiwanensis]|nr:hypothetical protein CT19431_MP30349 [Cupriavidus taiwanensis]
MRALPRGRTVTRLDLEAGGNSRPGGPENSHGNVCCALH